MYAVTAKIDLGFVDFSNQNPSANSTLFSTAASDRSSDTKLARDSNAHISENKTVMETLPLDLGPAFQVHPDTPLPPSLRRSQRAIHRPVQKGVTPTEHSKKLDRKEAVAKAVQASGVQRALSKGLMQAVKFSAIFLRNDKREFRRPPKETLTFIDYECLIPHLRTMSRLIVIVANIEDRPHDTCHREHWDAIFDTVRECFQHPERYNLEDRLGDVFRQILRYVVPEKLLDEKDIDLEETDFVANKDSRELNTRAQDFETLIDHLSVVGQKANLECELYTKARRKMGRKRAINNRRERRDSLTELESSEHSSEDNEPY